MTERQIKKLHKILGMQNQENLKKDIEICKEFYINHNYKFQERASNARDAFIDILALVKVYEYLPIEVIKKIELGM